MEFNFILLIVNNKFLMHNLQHWKLNLTYKNKIMQQKIIFPLNGEQKLSNNFP